MRKERVATSQLVPFISQTERSPEAVFCQSIRSRERLQKQLMLHSSAPEVPLGATRHMR